MVKVTYYYTDGHMETGDFESHLHAYESAKKASLQDDIDQVHTIHSRWEGKMSRHIEKWYVNGKVDETIQYKI